MEKLKFNVYGMSCSACSARVDKVVRELDGVKDVAVNLLTNQMVVDFDEPATVDERIKRVEEVAEQMEEERKKGISCRKKVSRFFRRSLINLDRSIRRCFGK